MPHAQPLLDARTTGLFARLGPGDGVVGMANAGVLEVSGPDAASFLHAGVTNEVEALAPGQGNASARVNRTGRLHSLFTVHAVPGAFLLLLERDLVPSLLADLDGYLFTEDAALTDRSDDYTFFAVQGPAAADALSVLPPPPAGWQAMDEGAIHAVDGGWVVRRTLTGDTGFVVLWPSTAPAGLLQTAAEAAGLTVLDSAAFSEALEVLRIEAGLVRVGIDTPGKPPLLPETGLEQHTVSYSKGCYLGQEVIARVRTYGSVPWALRALALHDADEAFIDALPESGTALLNDQGKTVGRLTSRAISPAVGAPVALAYLSRDQRVPGARLSLTAGEGGPHFDAEVRLLPLYRAPDRDERVRFLYDRAVRAFAVGDETGAIAHLQDTLRLDPTFADGYEVMGVILGKSGRYHEAIAFFRQLLALVPDEPMVHTNLSLYYMKIGDKPAAEAASAEAIKRSMMGGGSDRSAADVAQEQREARRKDALRKKQMFQMVLDFDPVDPIALFGLGTAQSTLEDWASAAATFAAATEADKNNSAVYLGHGRALEQLEQIERAIEVYQAGMAVASRRGDLMPLKEMEQRSLLLHATHRSPEGGHDDDP